MKSDGLVRFGLIGCGAWGTQHARAIAKSAGAQLVAIAEQLRARARLAEASREYSQALTDQQQDASVAAGAKEQSRPRLDQSGSLTGQQHWVRQRCAGKSEVPAPKVRTKKP